MQDRNKYEFTAVGDREFKFGMLDAVTASMLLIKMKGVLGKTIRSVGTMDTKELSKSMNDLKNSNVLGLTEIAASLIEAIDEDVFDYAAKKILAKTKIKNSEGSWQSVNVVSDFNGKVFDYMQVVVLGLRHNYADFLEGLSSKLKVG